MILTPSTPEFEEGTSEVVSASVRKFQKELSSGIVSLALLALLAHAEEPLYGYQIAKELEGFGGGLPVKQGSCGLSRPGGCWSARWNPRFRGRLAATTESQMKAAKRSDCGRPHG